jgi:aspartyl/asparaginyl-tRNA synthetase
MCSLYVIHGFELCSGLGKVWTFSPVFRAENQQSTRHLSEFYMVEAEQAFAYEIEDILEVMEGLVKNCIETVLSKHSRDWEVLSENNENLRVQAFFLFSHQLVHCSKFDIFYSTSRIYWNLLSDIRLQL